MIRLLELFGGIGACSAALDRLGIEYELADYVEIDKYAVASYNAIHKTDFQPQDITKWDKDIEVDLIMHGSPCQDFSIAGLGKGGDKNSGTRSSLMYETIRIVKKLMPKYVIWENVKNLLSKQHKHNFDKYISIMEELGYRSFYKIMVSSDYGIPQNRERVFTISILNGSYVFPKKIPVPDISLFLEDNPDPKFFLKKSFLNTIRTNSYKTNKYIENTMKFINGEYRGFAVMDYRYDEGLRVRGNNFLPTLTARSYQSITGIPIFYINKKLRFITPREAWRLQGFPDSYFDLAAKVTNEKHLFKQAGNSITVDVLYYILKKLLGEEKNVNGQMSIYDFL